MNFRGWICCLLVGINLTIFGSCSQLNESRWQREIKAFPLRLKMLDVNEQLVELTTDGVLHEENCRSSRFDTIFNFYVKDPSKGVILEESDKFDSSKPTFFVTHGWMGSGNSAACTLIRDAYLKENDVNVVIVDWNEGAKSTYGYAARFVRYAGERVAEMMIFLKDTKGMKIEDVTLVGHGLGAHIMGIAGNLTNGSVKTIFGLDPANPLFRIAGIGERLTLKDAQCVEVIHTNGGQLGIDEPIGTSNFYPNGGQIQFDEFDDSITERTNYYSHMLAYELFAESINSDTGFEGCKCTSYQELGYNDCNCSKIARMGGLVADRKSRGNYYLRTNKQSPYARGRADFK